MPTCSVPNCRNRSNCKTPGVTFHIIPKNEKLREEWLKAVSRENWNPSRYTYICSEHFSDDLYDKSTQVNVRLKPNAVPNIFNNGISLESQASRRKNEENNQNSSDTYVREPKRSRKLSKQKEKSRTKYDEFGIDKETGKDQCDCLEEDCPGCWMPCPNCKSKKCGHECRNSRRYKYDTIEIEGTDVVVKNQSKK